MPTPFAPRHALVIGGGIAGPVTAMFLQKAGITASIYEARSSSQDTGGGLQIAPNGIRVLKALGLDEKISAAGSVASHLCFRNSQGKFLSKICVSDMARGGISPVTISRPALHEVLLTEAAQRNIPVNYGKRLVAVEDSPGKPVVARFEDGTTAEGDILIGADGIWSTVRRLIMPDAPDPVFTGLIGIGGFSPLTNIPSMMLADKETMTMSWGAGSFFGYGLCKSLRANTALWWSNLPREAPLTREELRSVSQAHLRRDLLAVHKGWHEPVASLIENTEEIQQIAIYEMPSLSTWHRGRAVLIGDAAHAMATSAGQGASQALEDAMLLAKLLRDEHQAELDPMRNVFPAFEAQRRPRVEKISAIARRNSDHKKVLGPVALKIRDFFLAHAMPALMRHSWKSLYACNLEW